MLNGNRESCTARAIVRAVDPVSFTLSKVTLGRSSSSLSLKDRRGDSPSAIRCMTFLCILFSSSSGIMSLLFPSDPTPRYTSGMGCTTTGTRRGWRWTGLEQGGISWGMCKNDCPLRLLTGGEASTGDIFNRGTGVMTEVEEEEGIDNDDGDEDDTDLLEGGDRGQNRIDDEDDEGDEDKDDEAESDGEVLALLVDRSTGSVCIWKGSDRNLSSDGLRNLRFNTSTPISV